MAVEAQIESGVAISEEATTRHHEPDECRVYLLNDDFTTMEFVVSVLVSVFHKSLDEAGKIMLDVHRRGKGLVGVYSFDIATTKIQQVHQLARQRGFPLKCTMEKN